MWVRVWERTWRRRLIRRVREFERVRDAISEGVGGRGYGLGGERGEGLVGGGGSVCGVMEQCAYS